LISHLHYCVVINIHTYIHIHTNTYKWVPSSAPSTQTRGGRREGGKVLTASSHSLGSRLRCLQHMNLDPKIWCIPGSKGKDNEVALAPCYPTPTLYMPDPILNPTIIAHAMHLLETVDLI